MGLYISQTLTVLLTGYRVCNFSRRHYRINKNVICLDHKHGYEEQFPNSLSVFKNAHIVASISLVR